MGRLIKKNKSVFAIISLIVLSVAIGGFLYKQTFVQASAADNVMGWGWSENIGWISMNCDNPEISPQCSSTNYGVDVNVLTGEITGYAWSENIGWIAMATSTSGCPIGPCEAKLDLLTNEVSGWARVYATDAWISLRGTSPDYGVTYNPATRQFEGWAWEPDILGWISFNCNNPESSDCVGTNYNVYRRPLIGAPPNADFDFCLESGTTFSFFDTSSDSDGTIEKWLWDFNDTTTSNQQHLQHTFPVAGVDYSVSLSIADDDDNIDIIVQTVNTLTAPSCNFNLTNVAASACTVVNAQWDNAMGADEYDIYRAEIPGGPYTYVDTVDAQGILCGPFGCDWGDNAKIMNTYYEYYVKARRFNGVDWNNATVVPACGDGTTICPLGDTTPFCIASGVAAVSSACAEMTVSWDPIIGAAGYNLFRSLSVDGATTTIASTVPGSFCGGSCDTLVGTSYTDLDILSDVPYYYYVTTFIDDGEGGYIEGPPSITVSNESQCYRRPTYIER